jgi:hypothetical protein
MFSLNRHCEGPRPPVTSEAATELPPPVTTTTPAEPATTASEAEDDHTDALDPGPSPTESIGCEPHGDHWHCEGPREPAETSSEVSSSELIGSLTIVTTTAATTTTGGAASGTGALTSTTSGPVFTAGAAAGPMAAAAPIFGLAVFAALGL